MARVSFLTFHKKILAVRPLVAGTITGGRSLSPQLALARSARVDLVELRLDTFSSLPREVEPAVSFARALIKKIKKFRLPILLTLRSAAECGSFVRRSKRRSDGWRADVLSVLLPFVDMVDVEIRSSALSRRIIPVARKLSVETVLSYHNFHRTISSSAFRSLLSRAKKSKASVLKVAVRPSNEDELRRFLRNGIEVDHPKLVLIGMGALGLPSRILGFSFGSILTYGHLGRSAAPGQLSVKDVSRAIHSIYR